MVTLHITTLPSWLCVGLYVAHFAEAVAGDLPVTSSAADLGSYIMRGIGALSTGSSPTGIHSGNTGASVKSSATPIGNASTSSASTVSTSYTGYPFPTSKIPSVSPVSWSTGVPEPYFEHATKCWTEYIDWYHSWPGYIESHDVPTRVTSYVTYAPGQPQTTALTLYPSADVSTYKLCDDVIRANYTPSTTLTTYTPPQFSDIVYSTVSPSVPPIPCQLNEQDCEIYWFLSDIADDKDAPDVDALAGQCGFPLELHSHCVIQGGSVQLLYFPVATEGDLCASNKSTVQDRSVNSVVTALGTTFTSGTVYLSFDKLFAAYETIQGSGSGLPVGPTLTNTILAFKSEEISTKCYDGTSKVISAVQTGTRLNYADLNYPIAASVYQCQNKCSSEFYLPNGSRTTRNPNPCTTIWDDFGPILAMPTRISEMFPEWSTCKYWNYFSRDLLFDPPSALQQATAIPSATLPSMGLGPVTAPSPASTPTPLPAPTTQSGPQPTAPVAESSAPIPDPTIAASATLPDPNPGPSSTAQSEAASTPVSEDRPAPVSSLGFSQSGALPETTFSFGPTGATGTASDNPEDPLSNTVIASPIIASDETSPQTFASATGPIAAGTETTAPDVASAAVVGTGTSNMAPDPGSTTVVESGSQATTEGGEEYASTSESTSRAESSTTGTRPDNSASKAVAGQESSSITPSTGPPNRGVQLRSGSFLIVGAGTMLMLMM